MMWLKRLVYACALCLLTCLTSASAQTAAPTSFTNNSVLSTGEWYKLAVTESGVYKIDKSVLQALGISAQSIDPAKIQLYGNGGGMLPQPNSAPRPDDLQENAIAVIGEEGGKFDDADYILFYAKGPHTWQYDEATQQFRHKYNVYSDTAFYFLRLNHSAGARIATRGQAVGASQSINSYNEHLFYEKDLKNMVFSGREWYGEEFSAFQTSRSFNFPVSDVMAGSEVQLEAALMANSPSSSSFTVQLNNQALGSQDISGRGTHSYHPEGVNSTKSYTLNQQKLGNPGEVTVGLNFNTGGSSTAMGYLNYLELHYQRQLKLYGEQTAFRSLQSITQPVSRFTVSGAPANMVVWDVTQPTQPVNQQHSNGSFSAATDVLREFVVFQSINRKPIPVGRVENQNLHSLNQSGSLDFVIVAHPVFLLEAQRLANHRAQHSHMEVQVVTTKQVFNEFSSGAQDVTAIRDFMRMLYSRSSKTNGDVLYLLLFGDASYDYKNRLSNNTNFVPVYESRESLHPITSYSSEDYFGFLDEDEGDWAENTQGDHLLDIGIGRLPARTTAEAATMVSKIINYDSPSHFGSWRDRVTFVADDGDYNEHQNDAEFLANYLVEHHPKYNPDKVYIDLYQQQAVANGQRVPDASAALNKAVEQGSLITNYTGHGNEVSWASEQVLTLPQVSNWKNKGNLTFLLTATCEFGRYDDPGRPSGAELALLHGEGGAVGLLTTTRPVYSNGNRVLNRNFFKTAFTPVNGRMPRLGDLVMLTKNNSILDNASGSRGVNNRNFSLLSDPSMQLAYPALETRITSINGKEISSDTLNALSKVTLKGHVQTSSGTLANDFSGDLHLKVYEKPTTLQTLGDESSQKVPVQVRESILYDGKASVRQGQFEITFVVPKDISYKYGQGKISMYASNSTHDAMGANQQVVIGGTAKNVPVDNAPPTVNLFMDDESFVSGGTTGQTTTLLAKLFDDNGINTAGIGIGHEITAILDENQSSMVVLNDYYTAASDSYQEGEVKYTLKDLPPGPHTIRLKAWDTHNNSSEAYIEFYVSNDAVLALEHVLNYPNPFSSETTFLFDHNRAGQDLDIQVQVYNISGKLVKTLQATSRSSKTRVAEISWNGRNEYNDMLTPGVYIYRVNVQSRQDGAKASKIEKLVILN
ncbi:type IX secretion system sortase PorU [Pontibacter anaerobius]|uniref:Type IX secretion system sortase PorU n=1 Tax=Pontibacter anaerobius TaxID=2993940 RepID=A0ABT3RL44_9BACT|nr:type IX secretion system sortase PorU [Pontibacter anaerobius]MCX2742104.1 type IX secretion system sortase PorU [Pontibacter anaerobius]